MSLRSIDRWDHYVQSPPALFGLSRWWNIDGKIEIFCLLLNVTHLKGLMSVKTSLSPVTTKCSSNYPPTSTGPGSTGSVTLTRINKLLIAGFTYAVVLYGWICSYDEVQIVIFFTNETRKTGKSGLTFLPVPLCWIRSCCHLHCGLHDLNDVQLLHAKYEMKFWIHRRRICRSISGTHGPPAVFVSVWIFFSGLVTCNRR